MRIRTFVGMLGVLLLASAAVAAAQTPPQQGPPFKAGDKVEYKAENYPEKWAVGTVIRELPGGKQLLIREVPTQFFPEGFERAYSFDQLRPVTPPPPPPAADGPAVKPAPETPAPPAPAPAIGPAMPAPPRAAAGRALNTAPGPGATTPMSQQDVLAFLTDRLGTGDPFANPRRAAVLDDLRAEVLKRGVNFRYTAVGDFSNQLGKFGALSNVTAALAQNFGGPSTIAGLTGRWAMMKVGATTNFTQNGTLYQRQEYAGLAGSLDITADGRYVWDSPSGKFQGTWRRATAEEMAHSDKGGEGLVLSTSVAGVEWLAFLRNEEGPEGQGIFVTDLNTRNMRQRGTRGR